MCFGGFVGIGKLLVCSRLVLISVIQIREKRRNVEIAREQMNSLRREHARLESEMRQSSAVSDKLESDNQNTASEVRQLVQVGA